jgi:hypothetical protein
MAFCCSLIKETALVRSVDNMLGYFPHSPGSASHWYTSRSTV